MKKRVFVLLLITVMVAAVSMSACSNSTEDSAEVANEESEVAEETSAPTTIEEYAQSDPEVQKIVDSAISGEPGATVDFRNGNVIVYDFELTKMEGYKDKAGDDPAVVDELDSVLEVDAPKYGAIAKALEEKTGITAWVTVVYKYNGETVATRSYDSSRAIEETAEDEENKEKLIGTWYVREVYNHQGDNITDQMTDINQMFITFNEDGTGSYLFSDYKYAERTNEKGDFTWRMGKAIDNEEAVGVWTVDDDSANIYLHEGELFIDTTEMDSISTLNIRLFCYK